jgi:general secretion pathway protein G
MKRKAFTMVELIFVIVVLGILASVGISKMAVTRDDAIVAKGRSQVAAIRNALTLVRSQNMLQGNGAKWPTVLDDATASTDGQELFDGNGTAVLMDYPLYAKANSDGHWTKTAASTYNFRVMGVTVPFTYVSSSGRFDCTHGTANDAQKYCKNLTE